MRHLRLCPLLLAALACEPVKKPPPAPPPPPPQPQPARLVAVDVTSGQVRLVSGESAGSGPAMLSGAGLAVDEAGGRAFAMEGASDLVLAVDLATGDRSVLSAGEDVAVSALAVDATRNLLYALESSEVIAIDLDTGTRTPIATVPGVGPPGAALVLDATGERLYFHEYPSKGWNHYAIYGLDLLTGAVDTVSLTSESAEIGAGPTLQLFTGLVHDARRKRLLGVSDYHDRLMAIDPATGDRSLVPTDAPVGTPGGGDAAPCCWQTSHMAYDAATDRLYVMDAYEDAPLLAVDLGTGTVTVLRSGFLSGLVAGVALDRAAGRVLILDALPAK